MPKHIKISGIRKASVDQHGVWHVVILADTLYPDRGTTKQIEGDLVSLERDKGRATTFTGLFCVGNEDTLDNVNELVDHLLSFDQSRSVILDIDGSTYKLDRSAIRLWNENDDQSPVAISIDLETIH